MSTLIPSLPPCVDLGWLVSGNANGSINKEERILLGELRKLYLEKQNAMLKNKRELAE